MLSLPPVITKPVVLVPSAGVFLGMIFVSSAASALPDCPHVSLKTLTALILLASRPIATMRT